MLVAGVDSSTQATKVVVCDAATGEVVRQGSGRHPDGTQVDPARWLDALSQATSDGLLDGVSAIGVGGQQHGMVTLDEAGGVVRPALLWNDTRSSDAAAELLTELGGAQAWADEVGVVPVASITVTKLRWLAEHEPDHAERVAEVLLPHDWVTWQLLGGSTGTERVTDRGDASGTGYWSPISGTYRPDLLELAFRREIGVPRVLGPAEPAGTTPGGMLVSAGTGDNMGAALGLGAGPGDVVVSLGTSGVVSGVHDRPTSDPTGTVAGFADATGRFLPLVCTLNAARVLDAAARLLATDHAGLDRLALSAQAGAGGLVLLPYLDGERTPNLPGASGTLTGLRRANMTPENLARAAVEGLLGGLADGLDRLRDQGVAIDRVLLVGGASRSEAVRALAPEVLGAPVVVPPSGEYVAIGAARQAAWALSGAAEAPPWAVADAPAREAGVGSDEGARVRAAYAAAFQLVHG